jgi:hypothetical protein
LPGVITRWLRCSESWQGLQLELGVGALELVDRCPGTLEALQVYSESVDTWTAEMVHCLTFGPPSSEWSCIGPVDPLHTTTRGMLDPPGVKSVVDNCKSLD